MSHATLLLIYNLGTETGPSEHLSIFLPFANHNNSPSLALPNTQEWRSPSTSIHGSFFLRDFPSVSKLYSIVTDPRKLIHSDGVRASIRQSKTSN